MRFFQVKKDTIKCHGCESFMSRGEVAVWLPLHTRGGHKFNLIFHPQCFRDWDDRIFLKRYEEFKAGLVPRRKRGRPKIYQDGKAVHRYKMLIAYHKGKGHVSQEYEEAIKKLEDVVEGMKI